MNIIRRRLIPAVLVAGVCIASSGCTVGIFQHDSWGGRSAQLSAPSVDSNWGNGSPPNNLNDEVSSYSNDTAYFVRFAEHTSYRGKSFLSYPGSSSGNLDNFGAIDNPTDIFSSHQMFTSNPCGAGNCTTWRDTDG